MAAESGVRPGARGGADDLDDDAKEPPVPAGLAELTAARRLVERSHYDVAVNLAIDLRDLATREATAPAFARRFEALRKRQLRRRGFFDRWKRANESDSEER